MARAAWRYMLMGLGWIFVVVGIIGLFTPGLPGTVFLILAAGLFARSSPRFENWLLNHPKFGPPVVAWRLNGAIAPRIKAIAIGSMAASLGFVALTAPFVATLATGLVMALSAAYVATRPAA